MSVQEPFPFALNVAEGLGLWVGDHFKQVPITAREWDTVVEQLGGSIYMTWDWLTTWWRFYGQGKRLRLFLLRRADQWVGVLPLYLETLGSGPLSLKVARLVGANIPPKVFDPPLAPAWAGECLRAVCAHLEAEGCGLFSLGPVSEESAVFNADWSATTQVFGRRCLQRVSAGVHTTFRLPSSFEEYQSSYGRKNRKLRMLGREHPMRIEVIRDGGQTLFAAFEEFVRLHMAQWRADGLPGHFGAWPHGLAYNRSLVAAQASHGRVRLLRIWAGNQVVCAQYAFAWANRWCWELPARAIGPTWDRFSLGPSGIVIMLGEALKEGCSRVEGGLGHYTYKLRLGATEHPVWLYRFLPGGVRQAIQRKAAFAARFLLKGVYQKLWYRRIQPHLPNRWQYPQWKQWLKYDF